MRSSTRLAVAAACAGAGFLHAAGSAPAASLPAGSTAILSGQPSLFDAFPAPADDSGTSRWSVSSDGRYVAFVSDSDGLVADDDNYNGANVFVKDRETGKVTFVSRATGQDGEPAHDGCFEPAISDDGKRVAFVCEGALDPEADTNGRDDVYLRDIPSGTTFLVSRAGDLGAVGDLKSTKPALSANGEYVAFASRSTNLDPVASFETTRVYRRHIGGGNETVLVARPLTAGGQVPDSNEPSISDNGSFVAFTSFFSFTNADTSAWGDIYVQEIGAGVPTLASRAFGDGDVGDGDSVSPALAGDASSVAFQSAAKNLDKVRDNAPDWDVYHRKLTGPANMRATTLVSVEGAKKGVDSGEPSIDGSGNVVGFLSKAVELLPEDTNPSTDAYVKNVSNGDLQIVSRADGANGTVANADASAVAVSGDGKKLATAVADGRIAPGADPRHPTVVLRDIEKKRTFSVARPAGDEPFVSQGGHAYDAVLSADGRYTAFISRASGLGLPADVTAGVFRRDRVTGDVTLVSRADGPAGAPLRGELYETAISADGTRVAFTFDEGSRSAVYVRDIELGKTLIASRADGAGGALADGNSWDPALDAGGSRVAFTSEAANLEDGDKDTRDDVHVRDLETGRTLLASRADGPTGVKADGESTDGDINADGTRVAFLSAATNLGDGDTDAVHDIHVRDLGTNDTLLVNATAAGVKGDSQAWDPTIDASGTRVAFTTDATNLSDDAGPKNKVFVRDLAAEVIIPVSGGGVPAGAQVHSPSISPDGRYLAFGADRDFRDLVGTDEIAQLYRRDLETGATDLVSRPPGVSPARSSYNPDISDRGGCVSFETDEALIGPASGYYQTYVRAFRADCAVTDPAPPAGGDGAGGGPDGMPGGGPGKPSTTPRDRTAPVLTRVKVNRRRFRIGRAATAVRAGLGRGTKLSFRATEAGKLSVKFERAVRVKRRTKYRAAGTLTRRIKAGAGSVALSGRLGKKRMTAGTYRLTLIATDAAGNRSKPVRITLTIVKG